MASLWGWQRKNSWSSRAVNIRLPWSSLMLPRGTSRSHWLKAKQSCPGFSGKVVWRSRISTEKRAQSHRGGVQLPLTAKGSG